MIPRGLQLELAAVEAAVGPGAFGRGRTYARRGHVLNLAWEPKSQALTGSVVGQGGLYRTTAYFAESGGVLTLEEGTCSCPVGYSCKHVAAIAVMAAGQAHEVGASFARKPAASPTAPSWEAPLRALIGAPPDAGGGIPLAIELTLQPGGTLRLGYVGGCSMPGAERSRSCPSRSPVRSSSTSPVPVPISRFGPASGSTAAPTSR